MSIILLMKNFILILIILSSYGCAVKQNSILDNLSYQELKERLCNDFNVTILRDEVIPSKYEKKTYGDNGLYTYKNCYVDTHYLDINTSQEIINISTKNDSCDEYVFEDYKAYSVKKALIALKKKL